MSVYINIPQILSEDDVASAFLKTALSNIQKLQLVWLPNLSITLSNIRSYRYGLARWNCDESANLSHSGKILVVLYTFSTNSWASFHTVNSLKLVVMFI